MAWGRNEEGQLGIPEPNSGFISISKCFICPLGLKSDGSIVSWGAERGQSYVPEPNRDFIAISAGESHFLGLKDDGSIKE